MWDCFFVKGNWSRLIVTKNQIPGLCMHNIHDRIRVIWLFLSFPILFYHSYAVFVLFCFLFFFYFVVFLTWGKLYRTFLQIQFLWIVSAQKHKGVETKPKLSLVCLLRNHKLVALPYAVYYIVNRPSKQI